MVGPTIVGLYNEFMATLGASVFPLIFQNASLSSFDYGALNRKESSIVSDRWNGGAEQLLAIR